MKKILAIMLTVGAAGLVLGTQSESRAAIMEMEGLVRRYLDEGRSLPGQQAVMEFLRNHDARFINDYDYLEAKAIALRSLGDMPGYGEALKRVPAEYLKERANIKNALRDRWSKDIDQGMILIEKLADKEGPSLEGWVHEEMAYTFVAQDPLTDPMTSGRGKAALLLLERTGKSSYSRIRRIFSSLRLWVDGLRNKNNPKRLERLTAEDLETEETRSPRYRILLYDLMKSHPSIRPQALSYLDDIIKELQDEAATWPGGPPTSGSNGLYEKKARSKYWLAHAYYLKALNLLEAEDFFGAEKFFKLSSQFSPDATDAQFRYAYYYEKPFLSGKESYVQEYTRFLISRGKKLEALEALERLALFDHLMKKELAVLYNEMYDPATFKVYWLQLTARMLPQADDFAFLTLDNRTIKLSQLKGQWVLLDFWGVWCPPCVAELPQLEAFYKKTLMPQARNPKITLLTLDCRDRVEVVRSFMADQKYTFPVALGSDELVKYFRVIQYPTKVLITPSGQYVTISTPDWQDFIAGYVE